MDPRPSSGSGVRARSQNLNTSPASAAHDTRDEVPRDQDGVLASSPGQVLEADRPGSLPPFETYSAIAIEDVRPQLDGGFWPIKRVVGDSVEVSADILKEGHDRL